MESIIWVQVRHSNASGNDIAGKPPPIKPPMDTSILKASIDVDFKGLVA